MSKENDIEREQIRGLYIIGLLAVLVTIKLTVRIDPFTDQFLLYVITSWAVYSFCMIFAFSDIPKIATTFEEIAEVFLVMSLVFSIGYFVFISYVTATMAPVTVLLYAPFAIALALGYYSKKRLRETKKSSDR